MKDKLINAIRWVLVLPSSVLCAIIARFFMENTNKEIESFLSGYPFNIVCSAGMGAAFVYVGSVVAPSYKRYVAILLALIIVALEIYFIVRIQGIDRLQEHVAMGTVGAVSCTIGSIVSAYCIFDKQ